MDDNSERIRPADVYSLSKRLGKVDFNELVECSSGYKVIRYDKDDTEHQRLLLNLTKALNNFVQTSRKAVRFVGNRINDIGSNLEETITQEMRKVNLDSDKLPVSGYPDLLVKCGSLRAYMEVKSSSMKDKKVNHRLFYYTSGKKVKLDALHLLLQIRLSEERDKTWIVDDWTLRDLFSLKVGLKSEFNANQKDFDELGVLSSG